VQVGSLFAMQNNYSEFSAAQKYQLHGVLYLESGWMRKNKTGSP
jgi:hypothetical protein